MFIKVMLCMYVLALLLYVTLWQSDFLLPVLLAVGITFSAKMVAQGFSCFTASAQFQQIVYLFFVSVGVELLFQFMNFSPSLLAKGYLGFELLNFVPLTLSVALFYKYILSYRIQQIEPVIIVKPAPLIKKESTKKITRYYDILNEIIPRPMVGC